MIIKNFFTNSGGILVSRIFGFIRDLLTANILGANIYSDMFMVAFKLPNLFRRIFAEGAFTQAFLPAFTKSRQKGIFAVNVFVRFFLFILFLTLLVVLFSPAITKIFAYGFDDKTIADTAPLVSINFFYLILIYMVTFIASLLQYRGRFAVTAFSTSLLNISMITALLLSDPNAPQNTVYYLSFGVVTGGILQLLVHVCALYRTRLFSLLVNAVKYRKKRKQNELERKGFYKNFFHSVLGGSTVQLSAFVDTWLASFLAAGSISYLFYANRIFQLPLALFAIALSIGIFPRISVLIKREEKDEAVKLLSKGFWLLAFLLCASALGGIILSKPIVKLLFERGQFDAQDTVICAQVLSMYLAGLIPFGLSRIFSLWLFAHQRQKEAAVISAIALGGGILFSFILVYPLGVVGLALANSIGGLFLFILTIKAFGIKTFFGIIKSLKSVLLIAALIIEAIILIFLMEIFNAYL
ncbi:MAG: murein biosynthesis integral membrane protein MurJ [Campylobacteraceae bacterium]|jgi:putative peptidoglycan lipid II flippase|nr:murein biosynthesis integral membrane protein MurJ [Campylobacteraceae bacterium]